MIISDKLKKVIFKKLYEDLSHVEIIPYQNSIWFIDRKNEYWYFEYEKSGTLWWRYYFFEGFFNLFSLELDDYQPIISEWVEEVLNYKVETPSGTSANRIKVTSLVNRNFIICCSPISCTPTNVFVVVVRVRTYPNVWEYSLYIFFNS